MKKIKLSDLIAFYEKKYSDTREKSESYFEDYFQEPDIEKKLSRLRKMNDVIGDVSMPLVHFRAFLYAGQWYRDKDRYSFTDSVIRDIYNIVKDYDDMPISLIEDLLFNYDKESFEKYNVKEYIDLLFVDHEFTKEKQEKCIEYVEESKEKIKKFYLNEAEKTMMLFEQYPYDFVDGIKKIMKQNRISFDDLMSKLPPNDFFKPTSEGASEFYAKYNDYRFMFELLKGNINLDKFEDNDHIVAFKQIGQSSKGIEVENMYTSFTKEEYLETIKNNIKTK